VVTDFGLAREESDLSLTQTGMVAGTPQYMSPEQADGRQIDHCSDLFSLGAVMYFMATGRPPFKGVNQLDVLKNIRSAKQSGVRSLNPSIPLRLEQLIDRLLEKDPAKRMVSTSEVQKFLKGYSAHFRSPKTNAEPKLTPQFRTWSKPLLACVGIVIAIVILATLPPGNSLLFGLLSGKQPSIAASYEEAIAPIALESKEMDAYFADAKSVPQVRGVLTGFTRAELSDLVIKYIIQVPSKLQQTEVVEIDRNGRFELKMDFPLPYQEVMLMVGDNYFRSFVVHKDLTVRIDMQKLRKSNGENSDRAVTFSGADAEMVEYQVNYSISAGNKLRALSAKQSKIVSSRTAGLEKILASYNEANSAEQKLIDDYAKQNPSSFEWILRDDFRSQYYSDQIKAHIWSGESIPDDLWEEILQHQPMQLTSRSTDYYHNLNLVAGLIDKYSVWKQAMEEQFAKPDDRIAIGKFLNLYQTFVHDKGLAKEEREAYQKGKEKYLDPSIDRVVEIANETHISNLKKLEPAKAATVMVLGARADSDPMAFVSEVMPMLEEGWCKTLLVEEFQKDLAQQKSVRERIKRATSKGAEKLGDSVMSSDGIHMFHGTQKNAEEIEEALVSSFPGKAVIVDFWSLSCGACLLDMKSSRDVKEELSELPVEIVYVCLDSQYELWVEKIVNADVKGNHLFLDKKLSAVASEHFKISSHPSFLFIDQEGNYDSDLIRFLSEVDVKNIKSRLK
jgi:thiol-disulfide isomerase/thioredoxin